MKARKITEQVYWMGAVGPMDNFDVVPALGKVALIGNMWMGRLEIFTVFVMLTPEYWKKW